MAAKTIHIGIGQLSQISSIMANDYLIVDTPDGTGILNYRNLIFDYDQITFQPLIYDLLDTSQQLQTDFIELSNDIYNDLNDIDVANADLVVLKHISTLSSTNTVEGSFVALPCNFIEINTITKQAAFEESVACNTLVSTQGDAIALDAGDYKIRVDTRVTSLCSTPSWIQIFLHQDSAPSRILLRGSSFAATDVNQVGNLFLEYYFNLCKAAQISVRAKTYGLFNLGLPSQMLLSAVETTNVDCASSLQLSSCNMNISIQKIPGITINNFEQIQIPIPDPYILPVLSGAEPLTPGSLEEPLFPPIPPTPNCGPFYIQIDYTDAVNQRYTCTTPSIRSPYGFFYEQIGPAGMFVFYNISDEEKNEEYADKIYTGVNSHKYYEITLNDTKIGNEGDVIEYDYSITVDFDYSQNAIRIIDDSISSGSTCLSGNQDEVYESQYEPISSLLGYIDNIDGDNNFDSKWLSRSVGPSMTSKYMTLAEFTNKVKYAPPSWISWISNIIDPSKLTFSDYCSRQTYTFQENDFKWSYPVPLDYYIYYDFVAEHTIHRSIFGLAYDSILTPQPALSACVVLSANDTNFRFSNPDGDWDPTLCWSNCSFRQTAIFFKLRFTPSVNIRCAFDYQIGIMHATYKELSACMLDINYLGWPVAYPERSLVDQDYRYDPNSYVFGGEQTFYFGGQSDAYNALETNVLTVTAAPGTFLMLKPVRIRTNV